MEKNGPITLEELRKLDKPVNANIKHKEKLTKFDKIAIFITKIVGTMWCAIFFALLALIALPDAISGGTSEVVFWATQTFLQLVLLSIILVGQNLQNKHSEAKAEANFKISTKAELEAETMLEHLENQNKILSEILIRLDKLEKK